MLFYRYKWGLCSPPSFFFFKSQDTCKVKLEVLRIDDIKALLFLSRKAKH